jgi:hypothetical protein
MQREDFSMKKFQLTSSSLTQTTQFQETTFVTKNPPTTAPLPDNSDKISNELLLNISSVIKSALMSIQKKKNNSQRISQGAINKLQTTHEGASSLIALVNQRHHTNFQELDKMHEHFQKKLKWLKQMKKNMFEPTKLGIGF